MSKRIFTKEQIKILLNNPTIEGCSNKAIRYSKNFKVAAVRKWQAGMPPQEIFIQAGLDISMIGSETPKECLRRWRRVFKQKGAKGLRIDGRRHSKVGSGRPKRNWQNDKEKIKYLETEIVYLKAENDFLVKLRKKS
jgi:hypothetical protein